MSGLRAKQKADRNERILKAAVTLFRADGYRAARIEDMAEMAEVSPGTVYNYYGSKGDILFATVAMEVEEVLAAGNQIVSDPPHGAQEALMALIGSYYDHSQDYLSKEMWRTAFALSVEAPHTPNGVRFSELDRALSAQVVALITRLQARGEVAAHLDAQALGEVVFNNLNAMFMEFVKDDAMTLDRLKAEVARQIAPLTALISR
ncbi:TetR/AcrR family transcriptional regulator [Roseovarius nanhaiticus]|uniref:Transcriptional regulator, TetR family n=1 Tax=Roseovarius nanhaiticus TaxID=573024 RepID=A0A1N7HGF5_9RHOB|nr:TetR/AcrR family transcriptional regulator [Roseovarius nanhaiticus]SEK96529.1 transcriptional regulator, TetR family [Roseovarius nanhaiticus]SIS23843.1 transcriptional regulator, TetR family [Roseovarius nanhaiticus]